MKLLNKKNLQLNVQGTLPRSGYNIMNPQGGQSLTQSQMMGNYSQKDLGSQIQSLTLSAPLQLPQQQSALQKQLCFKDKMTKVSEGIYVGNYLSALNYQVLTQEKITHIINCSPSDCQNMFEQDITYLNINIQDNWKTNLFLVIYIILDFLRDALQQNGRVLIHCNQGISRSPSIIIAYFIYTEKINANIALEKLKKKYPYADPNLDFQIQLNEMYKEVAKEEEDYDSQGCHSQKNLVSTANSFNSTNHSNPQSPISSISSQKKPHLDNQVINNSQHVTISTPEYPAQKLNYGSYMQNKIISRNKLFNSSHSPINLYGSAQISSQTVQNKQNGQNLTLSANLLSNFHTNKLQLDTIHENRDKQNANTSSSSSRVPEYDFINERQDSQQSNSSYASQITSPEQFCLMPDLSYLKNQPILTLEQKQKMLFKCADSDDEENDIKTHNNHIKSNQSNFFLSQNIEHIEKTVINNQYQIQQQRKSDNEQNQLNKSLLNKNSNQKSENIQILNSQSPQLSKQISQDQNCDENTEILVKTISPLKKDTSKHTKQRNVGFEVKDEDLKNKLSDSDLDPLDSTDIYDFNTDTSASYSFDLQSCIKQKAKQNAQSIQHTAYQQLSTNTITSLSQSYTNNKTEDAKNIQNQQINLSHSEISS